MADAQGAAADEATAGDAAAPGSPGSPTPSDGRTPLPRAEPATAESHKRMPSLRSVSESQTMSHPMSSLSSPLGPLNNARRPLATTGMSSGRLPDDINAKMRAFHLSRQGSTPTPPSSTPGMSPTTGTGGPMMGGLSGGLPGSLRAPNSKLGLQRPGAPSFTNSAPAVPLSLKGGLAGKRGFKGSLQAMSGGPTTATAGNDPSPSTQNQNGDMGVSKMKQFQDYIDSEKGYLTFKGKAIITDKGVEFSDGNVFKISLDEVEKLDELGKGNYGTVYRVRHCKPRVPRFGPGLSGFRSSLGSATDGHDGAKAREGDTSGMIMAMKEIRLELDEAKLSTILKELLILHQCVSPYVIDFYGAFFQESAVYMCIEYMDGGSIDKLYAGGIPENVLRKITNCTIMGLKELKEKHNIIHRDVKPTNILVNSRGQVKICDFGVSGNLVASIAKTNIGCQSYMAPERISGGAFMTAGASDGTYSVQSDIWSLGLTIIECAMGAYPYPPEVSSTIFSQLSAIVEGDPPDLPEEGYSQAARNFVHACLNKVPKLRPNYQALLASEWIRASTKPETITEADEEEAGNDASEEAVADVASSVNFVPSGSEDAEVAAWAQDVLRKKACGQYGAKAARPALHAAKLDIVGSSPVTSPRPRTSED